jgi:hypothetical protein
MCTLSFSFINILTFDSGVWLVGSGYMICICGSEILQGLEIATGSPYKKDL